MVRSDRELVADLLDGDPFLTCAEVAAIVRVDKKTVNRWVVAGRFPERTERGHKTVVQIGGEIRIRESAVRRMLEGE